MIDPPASVRRVVYFGTPALAVAPLLALHDAGFEIPLVVSRADTRRGRGSTTMPSPVKAAALDLGVDVTTDVDDALGVGADLGVVVAYGRLIRPHVLDRLAMVNLHFSLLPRWRGAAPVERAILAGDRETGVCLMALEEELDTGAVYRRQSVAIDRKTLPELQAELVDIGSAMLVAALREGLGTPEPQAGEPTYARKIERHERRIDWHQPAPVVDRVVRIGNAWTTEGGRRLKIWSVEPGHRTDLDPGELDGVDVGTGTTAVTLVEVQPEGKPRRAALDWARGARLAAGERLGAADG